MTAATDWKQKYDDYEQRSRLVLEDAILAIHEKNVPLCVLAAGFHPFHPAGIELTEALRQELRDGDLEGADITRDVVWHLAEVHGLEPELTPIL